MALRVLEVGEELIFRKKTVLAQDMSFFFCSRIQNF
jgi:hypothetical protein